MEIVRRSLAAFEDDEDAWLTTIDPSHVWYPLEEGNTPSHGVDAARAIRKRWLESWESHRIDIEEILDRGDGVVLCCTFAAPGRAAVSRSIATSTCTGSCATARWLPVRVREPRRCPRSRRTVGVRRCRRRTSRLCGLRRGGARSGNPGVGRQILGIRRRLLPGSRVPGGEALPRTRGDRGLPYRVGGLGGLQMGGQ